jgi:hypothetical protein
MSRMGLISRIGPISRIGHVHLWIASTQCLLPRRADRVSHTRNWLPTPDSDQFRVTAILRASPRFESKDPQAYAGLEVFFIWMRILF